MFKLIKSIGQDISGATAVEYGLILALIFFAMMGAVQTFGEEAISMWTRVSEKVSEGSS